MISIFRKPLYPLKPFGSERGFTLVELIVAAAITGLVGYGLVNVYVQAMEIWREAEGRFMMVRVARRFQNQLRRDVQTASDVEIRNGYGGVNNRVRIRHMDRGGYVNEFLVMNQRLFKRGTYLIRRNIRSDPRMVDFTLYPLMTNMEALDGKGSWGIRVNILEFSAPTKWNRKNLGYDLQLVNKYGQTFRLVGWAILGMQ
jgi:prepilin-type N-terminal cleavage/methylation domain-containing protein